MQILPLLLALLGEFDTREDWQTESWLPTPHLSKVYPNGRIPEKYLPVIESVLGNCPKGLGWRLKFIYYAPNPVVGILPHIDFGTRTWKIAEFLFTKDFCVAAKFTNDLTNGLCLGESKEHDFITHPKYSRGVVILFEAPLSQNYQIRGTTYGQLIKEYKDKRGGI